MVPGTLLSAVVPVHHAVGLSAVQVQENSRFVCSMNTRASVGDDVLSEDN